MAEQQEVLLTIEGKKKLEEELAYLETDKRLEVKARLQQAIDFGDLSENSEYDDAKNEQAFTEGRILELKDKLARVKIISDSDNKGEKVVSMGSTVVLEDVELGEEMTFTIVGSMEADPMESRISNESPVGAAILGAKVGDTVNVPAPVGNIPYVVKEIK